MKTYLITGCASDIAQDYIRLLENRREDCVVYGQYRGNQETLQELQRSLRHVKLKLYYCGLRSGEETEAWIGALREEHIVPTNILHLVAVPPYRAKLENFDWAVFENDVNVQVRSLALLLKEYLPRMAEKQMGNVVVLLSSCTLGLPPERMTSYVMAKYALLGLVISTAHEYGRYGIRVNGISPSALNIRFPEDAPPMSREELEVETMLKQYVAPREACQAIDFLFSERSAYINGANINVAGNTDT